MDASKGEPAWTPSEDQPSSLVSYAGCRQGGLTISPALSLIHYEEDTLPRQHAERESQPVCRQVTPERTAGVPRASGEPATSFRNGLHSPSLTSALIQVREQSQKHALHLRQVRIKKETA